MNLTNTQSLTKPLFVLLVILLLALVILSLFFAKKPQSRYPDANQQYEKSAAQIRKKDASFYEQQQRIAQMRTQLPYTGKHFSLQYNYQNNQYFLILNQKNPDQGLWEFSGFLQSYGIPNKNLLTNLTTVYK